MDPTAQLEYVGFKTEGETREYLLRVRHPGGETRDVRVAIPFRAFQDHLARFQDGPEICFAKLRGDLVTLAGEPLPDRQELTTADLDAFRLARAPKPPQRRRRPAEGGSSLPRP